MKATVKLEIKCDKFVPEKGRAAWLERFGVPEPVYTVEATADLAMWESSLRNSGWLTSRGEAVLEANTPLWHALVDAARKVALECGAPSLTEELTASVLRERAKALQEIQAEEAAKKAEDEEKRHEEKRIANLYLEHWLSMPDEEMVDGKGDVKTCLAAGSTPEAPIWACTGSSHYLSHYMDQPIYEMVRGRRYDLSRRLRDERNAAKAAAKEEASRLLLEWGSARSEQVRLGLEKGYDMWATIGHIIDEVLEESLEMEVLAGGTVEYDRANSERREDPTMIALDHLLDVEGRLESLILEKKVPKGCYFDSPEICRVTMEDEDGDETEVYTAIHVIMTHPCLPQRWILRKAE